MFRAVKRGGKQRRRGGRRGAILILVLWMLLILSLIGLSYSSSVRTSVSITANRANKVKARWYAKAAVERTIVELLDREEPNYYSETSGFYGDEESLADQPIGDGTFSLITGRRDENGRVIYGITDEAGKLNINTATEDALLAFPEITEEMASSLLDWRDEDSDLRVDGAEDDYYTTLDDPYYCKNREFQTLGELLLVCGWTRVDLYGEDTNGNGLLDPNEDDGERSLPLDDADGELDLGLVRFFTVYSYDKELNPNGEERLDLNSASQEELMKIEGMTEVQARSIVAWREKNEFKSLADLFDVTEAKQEQQQPGRGESGRTGGSSRSGSSSGGRGENSSEKSSTKGGTSSSSNNKSSGGTSGESGGSTSQQPPQKVFDFDQIAQIVDWVCVGTDDKVGRININTAPYEVLLTLPGMTESLAAEIITYRESSLGPFTLKGQLREVNGMTEEIFRQLIDHVTVQSYQFDIVAEGYEGDVTATIEAVVDIGTDPPRILYWHES